VASLNALLNRLTTTLNDSGFATKQTLALVDGKVTGAFLIDVTFPDEFRKGRIVVTDHLDWCDVAGWMGDLDTPNFPADAGGVKYREIKEFSYEGLLDVVINAMVDPLKAEYAREPTPTPRVEIDENRQMGISWMLLQVMRSMPEGFTDIEPDDARVQIADVNSLIEILEICEARGMENRDLGEIRSLAAGLEDLVPTARPAAPRPGL
jgi:hypothetical protein